jgi:hypothetical protein
MWGWHWIESRSAMGGIEALFYLGHPLSAGELRNVFDEPESYCLSIVTYHLERLAD